MKILLLGEFSSLHKYLKEGLECIPDIEVQLASSGDGWKKIGGIDIELPLKTDSDINRLSYYRRVINTISEIKGYDVVQWIHPNIFSPLINSKICKIIAKNNNKLSMLSAGGDLAIYKAYREGMFEHYIYDAVQPQLYSDTIKGCIEKKTAEYVQKRADIIIPTAYEYSVGYRKCEKIAEVIPFPININTIPYKDNVVNKKVVFFHGVSREKLKGTPYIRAALEKLKQKYPDDVEIVIEGRMPYDQYIKVMEKANVLVDQCMGYGYGINGCIGMAQGKIVLSGGFRKENIESMGKDEAPGIYIKPDTDYIFTQLCNVMERKNEFLEWGKKSRQYVEDVHDYKKIAKQYLDIWSKLELD